MPASSDGVSLKPQNARRCRWFSAPAALVPARLLLAALLSAVACGRAPDPAPPEQPAGPLTGGTAIVAEASDITSLNPLLDAGKSFNEDIFDALYLQLFEEQSGFAEGTPAFAPELATSWQWSEDRRTLSIELRPDVVWSDGVPLTAEDVVWTWRMQTDDRIAWSYAGLKESILEIKAVDTGRLLVRFDSPSPTRLAELNQGHILPRHRWRELPAESWRSSGEWFRDNLVVSGPFRLADWQPDQQIVLERNPAYYRAGFPRLDRVVFRIIPEPSNRLTQLLAGAVDFVAAVPPAAARQIEADPDTRLVSFWARQFNFVEWNLARPMFAEAAARRALTQAVDRPRIVDTLWFGHAKVASSPIISSVWGHRADPGPWPYDPVRAAEELAALGWRDEDGDGVLDRRGQRFEFELLTNSGGRVRSDAMVMIQEDLRRIGVAARPRQLELNTTVDKMKQHDFDAVLFGFNIDTSLDLTYGFHSKSIADGYNFGGYANPEVDRLIDAARVEGDPAQREWLLREIQGILHDEQPLTFLWEPQQLNGVSLRLRGVQPNPLSPLFNLEEWWLAAASR